MRGTKAKKVVTSLTSFSRLLSDTKRMLNNETNTICQKKRSKCSLESKNTIKTGLSIVLIIAKVRMVNCSISFEV